MITVDFETAKAPRIARDPLAGFNSSAAGSIAPGERCFVVRDFQGWKTNVKARDALKIADAIHENFQAPSSVVAVVASTATRVAGYAVLSYVGLITGAVVYRFGVKAYAKIKERRTTKGRSEGKENQDGFKSFA